MKNVLSVCTIERKGREKRILSTRFWNYIFFTHSKSDEVKFKHETHRNVPWFVVERKISNVLAQLYFFSFLFSSTSIRHVCMDFTQLSIVHTDRVSLFHMRRQVFDCYYSVGDSKYSRAKDLKFFTSVVLNVMNFIPFLSHTRVPLC